jgi:hypothetical protein
MTRTLEAVDYWKLRAICSEASRCEVLALQARAELATAHKKQTAQLAALGFDPTAPTFTLDDDTLTITIPDAPEAPRANAA